MTPNFCGVAVGVSVGVSVCLAPQLGQKDAPDDLPARSAEGERAFAVISLSSLLIGVFVLWSAVDLYAGGGRARGKVTEIRESRSIVTEEVATSAGGEVRRDVERISFAPIVRFATPEGREIEFHGRGGSGTPFAAGEVVNVVYDRSQPSRARIVSFVALWLPAAVAFAVALIFGGAVRLSRWSRRRVTG